MNKTLNTLLRMALVVVLGSLAACGDDNPPAPKSQVVSKKIYTEKSKTKPKDTTVSEKAKDEAAAQSKPAMKKPTSASVSKKPAAAPMPVDNTGPMKEVKKNADGAAAKVTSDLIKASLAMASTYDPSGRIDPFAPLFSKEPKAPAPKKGSGKKKRIPQTPLEKVALNQLKLTAILRMPKGNRALVEDSTGKGYVVKKGTYIGLNAGQVIRVEEDRVLIEEEIQNVTGEYIINNTELKLQKTAGE